MNAESGAAPELEETKETGGGVRFGGVRVRKHRMTMGDNPGGATTTGPPVTLDWDAEESQRFSTLDDFAEEYHDGLRESRVVHKPVHRIAGSRRRDIAAEHHTEKDIEAVQKEIKTIRDGRKKSSHDPEDGSVKDMIHRKKGEQQDGKKNTGGILRLFKRR